MMKQLLAFLFVLILFLGISMQAHATLELRGDGTSVHGTYRLIYDTDFNITWYDYTKSGSSWQNQMSWASDLWVDLGGTIYKDWRLPTALNQDGTGPCAGYNECAGSEMGHLYYTELGNSAGGPLTNKGAFLNLQTGLYWSGTEYGPDDAWPFYTIDGLQSLGESGKYRSYYGIAVRPGDVAVVPEPISSILFLTGGATLIGKCYMKRKKS